jgi:hypothetical protein
MFSSIFYKNKFSNSEKMRKIVKESMDKYIRKLNEQYKKPTILVKYEDYEEANKSNIVVPAKIFDFFPVLILGFGVYQLSKFLFSKH